MGTAQQEIPVDKVYIVMIAEFFLLATGESFVNHSVGDVFLSRGAAEEYIQDLQPWCGLDQYFIKEVSVRS
jgi:hypothetical protein